MKKEKKPSVLIVDDQLGVRMLLSEAFSLECFEVDTAASGEEALELLKTSHPDVLFLDLKMPKKDGMYVFSQLKKMEYKGFIVLMTGMETVDVNIDVDYVLSKPFDIDYAIKILHQLLNIKSEEKYLS
ncbi:response regulator [Desulfitibacter alkalitolerans]|uniref:response regulator n=1 Tax=Desulfitibacter alkalitolerans TaxID=264641 RepID=UPI000685CB20|nr:response regulator [Desulfitibacter alkalitolerans]